MGVSEGNIARVIVTQEDVVEMYHLLDLIDAEFTTDPLSVQCFDSRIVKRVNDILKKIRMQGKKPLKVEWFFEIPE